MAEVSKGENLGGIREQIDEVDREIVTLLNKRMTLALAAGAAKLMEGRGVMDFTREDEVLRHVGEVNAEVDGPLTDEDVFEVYLDIFRRSRNAQTRAARGDTAPQPEETSEEWQIAPYIPGYKKKERRGGW